MNETRGSEIRALAAKFLAINKEVRLIGKDGRIQLPPVADKFYLNEIANWLSYSTSFVETNFNQLRTDYVMESKGYVPIKEIAFDLDNSSPGIYQLENQRRVTLLELYAPLNKEQLLYFVSSSANIDRNSYSHHRFLSTAIRKLQENNSAFIELLAEKLKMPIRPNEHYYNDTVKVLRKVHREILELEEKGHWNIIPMLYSLRDHGVIMSTNLNNVFKYEVEEWGLLYSYGFSSDTSYWFLVIMKNFFSRNIKRYETLLGKSPIENPRYAPEHVDDSRTITIPTGTKEKVKAVKQILGLGDSENGEESSLTPFQTMILLRVLQEKGWIMRGIDKYQFGLAYQILTGGSSGYFEKQYRTDDLTLSNLKTWSKKKQAKKALESISVLKAKLAEEVLPYISDLEKLT